MASQLTDNLPLQSGINAAYLSLSPLLLILGWCFYQQFLSPFAKVPGPFWAKFSRIWITWHSWKGDTHRVMIELHEKYGGLVRIAPNELSTSELSAIKVIYGHGTKFRKSSWYSVWQGPRKFDLFPERHEPTHAAQRRLIARAYAMDTLKDLGPYVDSAITLFLSRMRELQNQPIDLGAWIQLFAFDIIGEITFSKRFGFMDVGTDDGSFGQITTAMRSASWLGQVPWVFTLHERLVKPVAGNWLGINARHGGIRAFALREIAARKDRGSDHADLLDKLAKVHKEKPEQFDETAVASMVTSNLFAGSDTTAISTRSIVYHLLKYPQYLARLREEIEEHRARGGLSDPVSLKEADAMPYLQAVIYEALRCHPAIGMNLPRVVPAGGITINNTFIPAGSVIGVNPWVVGRNKEVYGDDADVFRPDRWLIEDNGDLHRFFFAFGAGARMCLGRNIGWMEMSKLIPTLLTHFDLELVDPEKPLQEVCWWMVMQSGLNVRLRPRANATPTTS